ncbi:MAG: hypothetical protein ABJG68_03895 [Crocinitomicaceae bacterium]
MKLTSPNAIAERIDDHVIQLTFIRKNIVLRAEEVMCGWSLALQIDPKRQSKILLLTAEGSLLDEEARAAAFEEKEKWLKIAMVVQNLGQTIMAKVSISKHTPSQNTQVFECIEAARNWLFKD